MDSWKQNHIDSAGENHIEHKVAAKVIADFSCSVQKRSEKKYFFKHKQDVLPSRKVAVVEVHGLSSVACSVVRVFKSKSKLLHWLKVNFSPTQFSISFFFSMMTVCCALFTWYENWFFGRLFQV